jgi:hypothetical protein
MKEKNASIMKSINLEKLVEFLNKLLFIWLNKQDKKSCQTYLQLMGLLCQHLSCVFTQSTHF